MNEQATRKMPFWLTVSFLVNLVLIGALGGSLLSKGGPDRGHRGMPHFVESASPEDVAAVRGVMRNAFEATRPHRDARRKARRDLSDALAKEPYDSAAVAQALETVRLAEQTMHTAMNDALSAQLADLTPTQRKHVAEAIVRGPRGRRGRRGEDRQHKGKRPRPE